MFWILCIKYFFLLNDIYFVLNWKIFIPDLITSFILSIYSKSDWNAVGVIGYNPFIE